MRVVLVTNALDAPTRGNHTTIRRWQRHVAGVELIGVPADSEQVLDPVPDVIHGYHAINGGMAALALARRYDRPLVISVGGTEVMEMTRASPILHAAAMVTCAFDSFGDAIGVPYTVVPRGVEIPDGAKPREPDGMLRALLPAGLRPVKDPLLAMTMANALSAEGLPLELRILGPCLDEQYAREVFSLASGSVALGEVAPDAMGAEYAAADVVWNTSLLEGGANALLEGMAHGCAVIARDAPGNRDMLPQENLFVSDDLDKVIAFHRRLLEETMADRIERMKRAHGLLRKHHSPIDEARALEAVWRAVS